MAVLTPPSAGAPALQVHAGPRALAVLRERGLRPQDLRLVPGAAGGPKGLVLNPIDRFVFGHWLAGARHSVHLVGASIGAWRMAAACLPDADAALAQLAEDYITQTYPHAPGKPPTPRSISQAFGQRIQQRLGDQAGVLLAHPHFRLHVLTSHGRHLLHRQGRLRMPAGYFGAFVANALHRRALGAFVERVVFSDPREPLPLALDDFRTHRVALNSANLTPAVLASCSIPFWLDAVHNVPGGPPGAYWDGGITDYHLHLPYAAMDQTANAGWPGGDGLVLYPHFQPRLVPGWLDKAWRRRHQPSPMLDNLVLLSPHPAWVRSLPGGKLPDRQDFKTYADDEPARMRAWRTALAESQRLADELAQLVAAGAPVQALPLV